MGLTNFVLTVAGVSAVVLLLRSDVKQSASIFRRNVKHIRHWLEEETAASSNYFSFSSRRWVSVIEFEASTKADYELNPNSAPTKYTYAYQASRYRIIRRCPNVQFCKLYARDVQFLLVIQMLDGNFGVCACLPVLQFDPEEVVDSDHTVGKHGVKYQSMEKSTPKELESKLIATNDLLLRQAIM
ncbi:hypothetical protein CR513_53570, partial [Mucuna pruriens]